MIAFKTLFLGLFGLGLLANCEAFILRFRQNTNGLPPFPRVIPGLPSNSSRSVNVTSTSTFNDTTSRPTIVPRWVPKNLAPRTTLPQNVSSDSVIYNNSTAFSNSTLLSSSITNSTLIKRTTPASNLTLTLTARRLVPKRSN